MTYMSPEQKWLLTELKKIDKCADYAMYCVVKEEWQITPATSDLFQASLTVLEMHARAARWIGVGSIAPHEAVQENVARIPVDKVRKMNPAKAESWLVEQLGYNKLKDKIESSGIDGRQLLKIAKMSQKEAAAALGIKMATAKAPQLAIQRSVATPSDTMHEKIAGLLAKSLATTIVERPATAAAAAKQLGARPSKCSVNVSDSICCDTIPPLATKPSSKHSDETVSATLGGLSKALVLHGDTSGALLACAEWLGVASDSGRQEAIDAYCNLWKRHGTDHLRIIDLSRSARSHWRDDMLKKGIFERLAHDVAHSGAPIETIDLSLQYGLTGPVLEIFFDSGLSLTNLGTLKMKRCRNVSGTIPPAIGSCLNLRTLDLSECGFSGASVAHGFFVEFYKFPVRNTSQVRFQAKRSRLFFDVSILISVATPASTRAPSPELSAVVSRTHRLASTRSPGGSRVCRSAFATQPVTVSRRTMLFTSQALSQSSCRCRLRCSTSVADRPMIPLTQTNSRVASLASGQL